MGELFLFLVVALTVAAIVFGVTVLVSGGDPGLTPVEPDGRAVPLPANRPLDEDDVGQVRFDTAVRGYRMAQVDQALQRAAYDIGYKGELIGVLEAEVAALREGRIADADVLRRAREAAIQPASDGGTPTASPDAESAALAAGSAVAATAGPEAPAVAASPAGPAGSAGPDVSSGRDASVAPVEAAPPAPATDGSPSVRSDPLATSSPAPARDDDDYSPIFAAMHRTGPGSSPAGDKPARVGPAAEAAAVPPAAAPEVARPEAH